MPIEPVTIAGCTVSTKEGGGVELVADRTVFTDREAASLAMQLLRAIPGEICHELLDGLLREHVASLPEEKCIGFAQSLLELHREAFEARVLFDRAQRLGAGMAEA